MNFEIRKIRVVAASRIRKNKKPTGDAREDFKRDAAQMFGVRKGAFFNHQFHHIIPRWLGGTSDPENLVLILEDSHNEIHDFIDDQVSFLIPGEEAIIKLPFPKFPMVWDPEKVVGKKIAPDKGAFTAQREKRNPFGQDWLTPLRRELSIYPQGARAKVQYGILVL